MPTLAIPPLISLEEHFFSTAFESTASSAYAGQLKHIPGVTEALTELGPLRLSSMNSAGIAMQIISHGPTSPTMSAEACRATNLQLHAACCAHPTRFAGFATLPMADPDAAGKELAFCVDELGFVGALIDAHTATGDGYDGARYVGFWYTVQSLGVPVYLHPTWAGLQRRAGFESAASRESRVADGFVASVAASGWGWHSEVALQVFNLFASGLFDRCPRLKIVLGHFGEMIPFMLGRIAQLSVRWGQRTRDFRQVWRENVWVTTSGVWGFEPLACMLAKGSDGRQNTEIDRILFSVDYPFAKNEWGRKWIEDLAANGMVDEKQLKMIAYANAEKLLGLRLKRGDEDEESDNQVQVS